MKCKIKNIDINYEIIGEGIPVLMIHGYYADLRLMKGCMEPIFEKKSGYKRIYFDLPGMGSSGFLNFVDSSDAILDVVIEFIKNIIKDENFLLVGESYGGYISLGLVHKLRKNIEGMLLICPCIEPILEKRKVPSHIVLKRNFKLLAKLSPSEFKNIECNMVVQDEHMWTRYKKEVLSGVELYNREALQSIKEKSYQYSFSIKNMEDKFEKPTMFLLGRQDSVVGYKDSFSILDNFPRATFTILDRAGHNLQIEQEKLFNTLCNQWLSIIENEKPVSSNVIYDLAK